MIIRPYRAEDESQVVALWQRCGLVHSSNDPFKDIARKISDSPELFLVGTIDQQLVATAMTGYDGHRGWINYLGIASEQQRSGLGAQLVEAAEARLRLLGCAKVNVQVRLNNAPVLDFYRATGFSEDPVVSFGKRLIHDS